MIRKYLFLVCLLPCFAGCSSKTFFENADSTHDFFSDNLVFTRPENLFESRKQLYANVYTIQAAKQKRQEISYDPYYPIPKPWSEKPEATDTFPQP